ncbi:hypothetical protein LAJ19_05140 [Deinococcus taeanensis]|uniref:hypothetical protein n=1 Tax=Deinococcus taeanensis TaxID=2737050 RepID=UPI001CDD8728|nr:hypothetical protein [Deinococcus taeanensis]UBV43601.1 hypothetical protein LAJ19_05140 [Deinococcus taeanensis]
MPSRPTLTLLFAAATAAAAATLDAHYYPHKPGTRWTYASGETQVVGAPVTHRGVNVVPVSHQYGSTTYTQDLLEYRKDGSVWLRGVNAAGRLQWYAPPLMVYPPAPLAPGRTWQSATGPLRMKATVTGVAPLALTAGTFNALSIRTETTAGGKTSVQTSYFVPTVGIVRYETADGARIDLQR